ncbi:secreted pepsinogen like aspartyl protease [Cryptosporidium ubiquitum]|uniref:Secreted pepsinogen like aspartyl protease n=1 Tax=Cryptosporidium ubiquitum TaxID=857276 RepID=A0A1J4MFH7_9CRYT|nr:secreted pepsinogen like aspartyl protease [Cryptosporidium ubiquitum]OII72961.1 secreted pepsinogen like aspartyl protease [Cryptosporidium ubiquitum]
MENNELFDISGNFTNEDVYKWSSSYRDYDYQDTEIDNEHNSDSDYDSYSDSNINYHQDENHYQEYNDDYQNTHNSNSSKLVYSDSESFLINPKLKEIYNFSNNKQIYKTINVLNVNGEIIPYDIYLTNVTIPLFEIKNSLFVCRIRIGEPEQEFWPIIDTGSSNLWVIGDECNQSSCQKVKRYSKYISKSFKRISKYDNISVIFGTGKIYGKLILETLKFDNFQLNQHVIGIIEEVENTDNSKIDIFDAIELEGVLGLGFTEMSSSKKLQLPLIERLKNHNLIQDNVFSIYINDYRIKPINNNDRLSKPSAILLLGGIDQNLFYDDLHILPVIREHYWQVELESLYIGDTKYCCDYGSLAYEWENLENEHLHNKFGPYEDPPMDIYIYRTFNKSIDKTNRTPGYVIFDSGTSFYTLPNFEYKHFIQEYKPFGDCSQIHLDSKKIDPKITEHFPNFTYTFKDGFQLIIPPELYLTPNEEGKCKPGIMMIDVPGEYGHSYLLGSLFMRSYYTVYAKNIPKIGSVVGIAKAKHNKDTRKYIYNKLSSINESFVPPNDDEAEFYWTKLNGKLSENWKFPPILSNLFF